MMIRVQQSLSFFVILLSFIFPFASSAAEEIVLPLPKLQVLLRQEDKTVDDAYHIGIDAGYEYGAGEPVYAISKGIVRYATETPGFGYLVMIEHTLSTGEKIVSQYGHLSPQESPVHVGSYVETGDVIGTQGKKSENGGWIPHIHFALFEGAYSLKGGWKYFGHVRSLKKLESTIDPYRFFKKHIPLTKEMKRPHVFSVQKKEKRAHMQVLQFEGSSHHMIFSQPVTYLDDIVDVATADFYSDGSPELVLAFLIDDTIRIDIYSKNGVLLQSFNAVSDVKNSDIEIVTGDVFSSSQQEIILALSRPSRVEVFSYKGKKISSFEPFSKRRRAPLSIDTIRLFEGKKKKDAILVFPQKGKPVVSFRTAKGKKIPSVESFKAFSQLSFNGTIAAGNITADSRDEILIATKENNIATVRVYDSTGIENKEQQFFPFSGKSKKNFDIRTSSGLGDLFDTITLSPRSGRSRIHTYTGDTKELIFDSFLYGKKYRNGLFVDTFF